MESVFMYAFVDELQKLAAKGGMAWPAVATASGKAPAPAPAPNRLRAAPVRPAGVSPTESILRGQGAKRKRNPFSGKAGDLRLKTPTANFNVSQPGAGGQWGSRAAVV